MQRRDAGLVERTAGLSDVEDRVHDLSAGSFTSPDVRSACDARRGVAHSQHVDREVEAIAWPDGAHEARVLDLREHGQHTAAAALPHGRFDQAAAELCERFEQQHPRHDWVTGKMIAKVLFIRVDLLVTFSPHTGVQTIDAVDQKESHDVCMLRLREMSDNWTVDILLVGSSYSSTCTLVANDRHRAIVDSGLSLDQPALEKALRARRLEAADIDIVINTHLHLDHCGNNVLFPRAAIFLSREEWQWARAFYAALFSSRTPERAAEEFYPELRSYEFAPRTIRNAARLARLFWKQERLGCEDRFRWIEAAELPQGLEAVRSPGHTPFHISVRVAAAKPVMIAGDAVLAEQPDAKVRTMIPHSHAQYVATRARLMKENDTIVPGHGPMFQTAAACSASRHATSRTNVSAVNRPGT